jgi:hypothetical protein
VEYQLPVELVCSVCHDGRVQSKHVVIRYMKHKNNKQVKTTNHEARGVSKIASV